MYNQDSNYNDGEYANPNVSPPPLNDPLFPGGAGSASFAPPPAQNFSPALNAPTRHPASLTSLLDPPDVVRIAPRKARPAAVRLGSHSARYDPNASIPAPAPAPAFKPAPLAVYRSAAPAPASAEPLGPMAPSISIAQTTAKAPWHRAPRNVHTPIRTQEALPAASTVSSAIAYDAAEGLDHSRDPILPMTESVQATPSDQAFAHAPSTPPSAQSFHETPFDAHANLQNHEIPASAASTEATINDAAATLATTLEAKAKEFIPEVGHLSSGASCQDSQQPHMTLAQRLEAERIARTFGERESGAEIENEVEPIALEALSAEPLLLAGAISSQGISRAPRMAKPEKSEAPGTEPAVPALRIPVLRARTLAQMRPVDQDAPATSIAQESALESPAPYAIPLAASTRQAQTNQADFAPRLAARPIELASLDDAGEKGRQAGAETDLDALARQYQALVGIESSASVSAELEISEQDASSAAAAPIETPLAIEPMTEEEIENLESTFAQAERKTAKEMPRSAVGPKKATVARRPIPAKAKIQAKPSHKPVSTARNAILGFFLSYAEQFELHIGGPLLTIWRNKYVFLAGFMHVLIPLAMAYFFSNWNSATQAIFFDGTPVTILGKLCWLVVICGFMWTLIFMVASRIASTFKSDASRFERIGRGFNSPHNDE